MLVDIHTHLYPSGYLDRLRANTQPPSVVPGPAGDRFVIFDDEFQSGSGRPFGPEFTSIAAKLAYMDRHGIDLSVISLGNPWVDFMAADEAAEWAVRLNDELDTLCAGQPRLRAMGVLPLQQVQAACAEAGRMRAQTRLVGAILGTRPGGRHLDDPALDPFWQTAAQLGLPLFLHPHYTIGSEWMRGYGQALHLALGFTFETTAAAARLILGGVLDRHPDLVLILAHGGGTLPYLAGRLEACVAADAMAGSRLRHPFTTYLQKLYYDALVYRANSLTCAADLAGTDHLMFGSDHPFGIADPVAALGAITAALLPAQADEVRAGNALRLFALSKT